ncbi:MAG: alpha/beta fold hydrolase [Acutalibacteraceae bacterium]|nr:alpha/beta fold hydrolase [Acutalibacteraceae bacterium]
MENSLFVQIKKGGSGKQVVFFPYLGGYVTAFNELIDKMDDDIEIWVANPPGHGISGLELIEDMTELVDVYYNEILKIMGDECYFFGHSMGGNIAYFLAKKICNSEKCDINPKGLIISASAPPLTMSGQKYSELPDSELMDIISGYGALPDELLEDSVLMSMLAPIFRADYKILETGSEIKIDTPLNLESYLIWGDLDKVEPINLLSKWLKYFDCKLTVLPVKNAGHMLINSHSKEVAEYVKKIMTGDYYREDDDYI